MVNYKVRGESRSFRAWTAGLTSSPIACSTAWFASIS